MPSLDPTIVTFAAYLLAMITIGLVAWRRTRNLSDYILGGRRLGAFVTAMSAGASDMSGWLLMGLPGALFAAGLAEAWIAIGLTIGAWLNWYLVAGRLRAYTELAGNALTLPDYLSHRFEDRSSKLRVLTAGVILVFFTIYCASGMVAGARLFEGTFGLGYFPSLWAGAAVTVFYVFIGGFLAVSWTDAVQATLMVVALVITPIMVLTALGGAGPAIAAIERVNPGFTDWFGGITGVGILSLLAWGLGYAGQPHILARFMAAKNVTATRRARRIGMAWMVLCLSGAVSAGFLGIAYFAAYPEQAGPVHANRELVFMTLAKVLFNPWLSGLVLSAILAAIMSTLSCQLLVCASALAEDFYRPLIRPRAPQTELVWFGRAMVLLVSGIAMTLASDPESRVLGLVGYAWAGFGSAFGPVILLSLMWPRMTQLGALAGMITGAATAIVWHNGAWFGYPSGPIAGLYEIVPGCLLATIAVIAASTLDDAPPETVVSLFDEMRTRSGMES